jgi:Leucine-rich repeat (LRR) protein
MSSSKLGEDTNNNALIIKNNLNKEDLKLFESEFKDQDETLDLGEVMFLMVEKKLIVKINVSLVQKCVNLAVINLKTNQIEKLEKDTFQQCINLVSVNLAENRIKTLQPETFQQCKKLREISFASNRFEELNPNTFKHCENLQRIDFSSNQIEHLHSLNV